MMQTFSIHFLLMKRMNARDIILIRLMDYVNGIIYYFHYEY